MQLAGDTKKTCYLVLIFVTVAGCLIGGLITTHLALGNPGSEPNASQTPTVMRAERFELVNKGGKVRAALVQIEDNVGLLLFDADQKPQALLEVGDRAVQFKLVDRAIQDSRPETGAKSLSQYWHFSYAVPGREENPSTKAP